jgi:putative PIN family toxin of toxin-antitoxin system
MRVVIDTNILIGALTKPGGSGARLLRVWRRGQIEVVTSDATLREAELVLGGRWLSRLASPEQVKELLDELRHRSVRVRASPLHDIQLKDKGDRYLVEAAVAGDAGYLVTSDREVLQMRGYEGTEFLTPGEFVRVLRSGKAAPHGPAD